MKNKITDLKYRCDKCGCFTDKAYLIGVSKVEVKPLESNSIKELSDNLQILSETMLCEKCYEDFIGKLNK